MKLVLDESSKLADIAVSKRNGVWLLPENTELEVRGNIVVNLPIKASGNVSISGADGSSLTFVEKGSLACSSAARRLSICNLAIRSETEKPVLGIAQTTARTLLMHNVVVDAKAFGHCHATNVTMSQCSFLNPDMTPMVLGNHVDSLVLNGIRHDGDDCLFDVTQTNLDIAMISEVYIKNSDSGLLLLNDKTNKLSDRRYHIYPGTIVLKNVHGLDRDLDIFRQRREDGKLVYVNYNLTEAYVI